jgi:hypothetical protein
MASRWLVERDPAGSPAASFDQLAERWAAGELSDSDRVRMAGSDDWIRLDEVVGLQKAAAAHQATRPRGVEATGRLAKTDDARSSFDSQTADLSTAVTTPEASRRANPAWQTKVPLTLLIPGSIMAVAAGWMMWRSWYESRRFPRPLHDRADPGWNLPWIGPVSTLEAGLIAFDCVLLIIVAIFWHRRRGS